MSNLNTMLRATREPIANHTLVLELGGGMWVPGIPAASDVVHQILRHTWRLSMDGQLVDVEPEDKAWTGYHVAPETCHPP